IQFISGVTAKRSEISDEHIVNNSPEYKRVDSITQKLEVAVKGDTISVWPIGYDNPLRLSFFGEECEEICIYDLDTGRKLTLLPGILLNNFIPSDFGDVNEIIIINPDKDFKDHQKIIFTNKNISHINKFHENIEVIDTDFV